MEAWIISRGEGKVMGLGSQERQEVEFWRCRAQNSCFWIMGTGYPWEVKALVNLEEFVYDDL